MKKTENYPKKFCDKRITIQSKMSAINFVKMFTDTRLKTNGKKLTYFNYYFICV